MIKNCFRQNFRLCKLFYFCLCLWKIRANLEFRVFLAKFLVFFVFVFIALNFSSSPFVFPFISKCSDRIQGFSERLLSCLSVGKIHVESVSTRSTNR